MNTINLLEDLVDY